jgi:hypothetical protein
MIYNNQRINVNGQGEKSIIKESNIYIDSINHTNTQTRRLLISEETLEDETSKFINYGQSTSTKYLTLKIDET